jgi:hypothetical protein
VGLWKIHMSTVESARARADRALVSARQVKAFEGIGLAHRPPRGAGVGRLAVVAAVMMAARVSVMVVEAAPAATGSGRPATGGAGALRRGRWRRRR